MTQFKLDQKLLSPGKQNNRKTLLNLYNNNMMNMNVHFTAIILEDYPCKAIISENKTILQVF